MIIRVWDDDDLTVDKFSKCVSCSSAYGIGPEIISFAAELIWLT
jgi:hypothetical protein